MYWRTMLSAVLFIVFCIALVVATLMVVKRTGKLADSITVEEEIPHLDLTKQDQTTAASHLDLTKVEIPKTAVLADSRRTVVAEDVNLRLQAHLHSVYSEKGPRKISSKPNVLAGYWKSRIAAEGDDPFLAYHLPLGGRYNGYDVPPDGFVIDESSALPHIILSGADFRQEYEPALVARRVMGTNTKTKYHNVIASEVQAKVRPRGRNLAEGQVAKFAEEFFEPDGSAKASSDD